MEEAWIGSPPLSEDGTRVYNCYDPIVLVHGPRKSGKTISILHKVMRHAVENINPRVGIFTKSQYSGNMGVWAALTGRGGIVDQWIAADKGISYAIKPRYSQASKMAFCQIRTEPTEDAPDGSVCEVHLHSVYNEDDVEVKFKEGWYTLIILVEWDRCKERNTFTFLRQLLRSASGFPEDRFQTIIDCNPPEEGTDHWLYDAFFGKPIKGSVVIPFSLDNNPFISQAVKDQVYDDHAHDKALLDRMYYGLWNKASATGVFADVFLPNIHVVGKFSGDPYDMEHRDKWSILRPPEDAWQFSEGWDVGDVNYGFVMGVPVLRATRQPNQPATSKLLDFYIIDEACWLDSRIGLEDLTDEVMTRREYWQDFQDKSGDGIQIKWKSWSDSSSMRHRSSGRSEAEDIRRHSGGSIILHGVRKSHYSIQRRVTLLQRLLFEKRIFISPICELVLEMIRNIQRDVLKSRYKHIFDALTYMLAFELPDATDRVIRRERPKPKSREFQLI